MKFSNMLIGVMVFLFFTLLSICVRADTSTIILKPAPQTCTERCTHGPAGTICIKDCY